jgi:DNA-binding transcriptional ArsR family regulator
VTSVDPPALDSGDRLLEVLAALDNPHRLAAIATLVAHGRQYVSQLARDLELSRPLMHMHLRRLEDAHLVWSEMEVSEDGRAMRYYDVTQFAIQLSPARIAELVSSPPVPSGSTGGAGSDNSKRGIA